LIATRGAVDTYAAIRSLFKSVALKRIPVGTEVARGCISWMKSHLGHKDERYLCRLIEKIVGPSITHFPANVRVCRSPDIKRLDGVSRLNRITPEERQPLKAPIRSWNESAAG
jgi:hypothetical protein